MKRKTFLSCIFLQLAFICTMQLSAQVPQLINYQAKLTDPATHTPVADGSYTVTFSIYDVATGGTALWTETQSVQTTGGIYSVLLGSLSPIDASLFSGTERYLGVTVGSDPEMTPRKSMVSVPYAFHTKTADTVTGTINETDPTWDGTADPTGNIGRTGNVGIGINTPIALLHAHGTHTGGGNVLFTGSQKDGFPGNPPVSGAGTRMMWYPDKAAFRAGYVTGNHWDKDSIGAFSVAMGDNTRAKGRNSTALGNNSYASGYSSTAMGSNTTASGFYSTAIGNYTTAPSGYETAIGRYNTEYTPATTTGWDASDRLFAIGMGTGSASRLNAMTILKNGNTGIGTELPGEKLEVNGNVLVHGNVEVEGVINADILIDSIHVSKITGLLGHNYTMIFPDIINNYAMLKIDGISLTEKVIIVCGVGHETERISVYTTGGKSFEYAGVTMEHPLIFETGTEADVNTLKAWFDTATVAKSDTLIITDLAGIETERWNFSGYIPYGYEPGNDGRTRFTLVYDGLPDNSLSCLYVTDNFGNMPSFNPATDKWVEINGIVSFQPMVEVDTINRTVTLTYDHVEGHGIYQWSRGILRGYDDLRRVMSVVESPDGITETSRQNFFECIPIKYEQVYGFGQNIKLKARVVIAFGYREQVF